MKKIVTTALALLMSTTLVVAAPHGKGEKSGHGRKAHAGKSMKKQHDRMAEKLGLSEAQKQELRQIRERRRDENREFHSRMRASQREYQRLKQDGDPRAEAARAEVERYREEAKLRREQSRNDMLRILTPEQRRQFDEMRDQRDQRERQRPMR